MRFTITENPAYEINPSSCLRYGRPFPTPLLPDEGDPGWFQNVAMGHQGNSEFLVYRDPGDDTELVDPLDVDTFNMDGESPRSFGFRSGGIR